MPDLKTYLAAKYMSGPKADAILARAGADGQVKKKRKRPKNEDYIGGGPSSSTDTGSSGLRLKDEDEWRGRGRGGDDDWDGEDAPVIGKDIATFKTSKSAWATVGASALPLPSDEGPSVKTEPEDTKPDIRDDEAPAPPKQLTKRRGGLRTAAQMAAEAAEAAATRSPSPPPPEPDAGAAGTVHRDQTGRIVDVEALREAARREAEEEKRKEAERKEWSKGLVQRDERAARAKHERAMGEKDVARYADDVALNKEMAQVERWNDPAARFLKQKKTRGPKRPMYKGAFPPNRFHIPPGFRWDGVDRSTGFEKKYFQAQNAAGRRQVQADAWGMEDM